MLIPTTVVDKNKQPLTCAKWLPNSIDHTRQKETEVWRRKLSDRKSSPPTWPHPQWHHRYPVTYATISSYFTSLICFWHETDLLSVTQFQTKTSHSLFCLKQNYIGLQLTRNNLFVGNAVRSVWRELNYCNGTAKHRLQERHLSARCGNSLEVPLYRAAGEHPDTWPCPSMTNSSTVQARVTCDVPLYSHSNRCLRVRNLTGYVLSNTDRYIKIDKYKQNADTTQVKIHHELEVLVQPTA